MMRFLSTTRVVSRSFASQRPLAATEEFPFNAVLTPSKPVAASIKESKLPSGVKVITRDNGSPTVNIKIAVLGGSRSETWNQKGSAHFLAAAAYSGNHKNSGIRIVRYLESLGASIKSSADREKIVYDMTVMAHNVDAAFAGLATAVSTPPHAQYVFDEDVQKIAKTHYDIHHHDLKGQVIELLHEAAYGETAPLGGSVFAQNVARLSHEDVITYRKTHFVADNIVVAASGISHEKLSTLVEQHVEGGKSATGVSSVMGIDLNVTPISTHKSDKAALSTPSPFVGGVAKLRVDVGGESHLGLAFATPSGDGAKPFKVLHRLLADKFGDNVFSFNYSSGGLVGFYTSGSAGAAGANVEALIAELKAIANGSVDVAVAKNKVALDHFLALESSDAASTLLNAHVNGVSAQSSGDVRAVTKEDVAAAAKTALKSEPAYAVLGTTAFTPSFANILKSWK